MEVVGHIFGRMCIASDGNGSTSQIFVAAENILMGISVSCFFITGCIKLQSNVMTDQKGKNGIDLFLKNDAMHDPMVNESYCETFGWVSKENLARMKELTYKANDVLKKLFDDAGLILVDFKLEFGLYKGEVVLGDEFSPDGSRLWDKETLEKMDKDRFRQSLGGLIEAYEAVARRLGVQLD